MKSFSPKIGEILVVDFGLFYTGVSYPIGTTKNQFRHKPEMPKKRLGIVLNNKISGGCLIIPISTTRILDYESRGWHVRLPDDLFCGVITSWSATMKWAICQHLQPVSFERIEKVIPHRTFKVDPSVVEEIQRGVVCAISAKTLLK